MLNSKVILSTTLLLTAAHAFAQTKQKASIEHITVFLSGAEIESKARVTLPKGESEVLFTNIAGNIVQQSISVGVGNGVVVQSATAQNDYLVSSNLSPKAQEIKDSIDILKQQNETLADKKSVLDEQLAVIRENRKVTGANTGLSVAELQKFLDLINAKMNGLLAEGHTLSRQMNKTNERLVLLNKQLEEERKKDFQPGGQLLVKFYAAAATTAEVNISYVTPNAGWTPSYDLRVDKINSPVKLVYKANIVQNSGVKWDNVKLSLSTGNPNEGVEAPVMSPWYLSFYQPVAYGGAGYMNRAAPVMSAMKRAKSETYEAEALQDVSAAAPSTVGNYVQVDNSGINTTFDIDLNYTVPSDGLEHLVAVKDYELPATYRYYVAPKLDRDAFLQARITNWEDLNLMPAATNIFYEGAYVGQGYIDMRNVKDTLNLSLGRDKKIIVRRENDKNYRSVKTLGSNIRRSYGYTIEVRNTKKENIDLVVSEQFPVSNDKDISVEDKEAAGASVNSETGAVQWDLSLKPNEVKTLKLNYSVKYPKDKNIGNL
ncbi:MAG TPA: DUF4139 domain-containing protein [Chitinophagaceae bacterium]|nr:DUF4139 domain-containing protein [Chitinophagaceae bacterium]